MQKTEINQDPLLPERDAVFAQEQAHLTDTWDRLAGMEKDLEEKLGSIAEQAAAEKRDIRENLSLNFDGDAESMETYIEFEVMNHAIDHYNIERDLAAEKLGRVKRLLKAPYFAKVRLRYDPEEEPEEYYIGSAGISENALEPLVIDWRSPVAETYYNQENGRTFYHADGRRIDVDLLLRRQFELAGNRLHAFFDTQVALSDPLLIRSLTQQRTGRMQAITATIQKEQNAVVRHENVPVLLVNGIAGSGKTSVLLQRIAWLFYRQRDTLRPDEVVLMTLNPFFRRYIDQVLPDMGEQNPVSLTWGEFLSMAGVPKGLPDESRGTEREAGDGSASPSQAGTGAGKARAFSVQPGFGRSGASPVQPGSGEGRGRVDLRAASAPPCDTLLMLEERLPSFVLEPEDLRPIRQKNLQVLSRQRIAAVLAQHPGIPTGERLIQIAVDELSELAKREIRRRERDERDEDAAEGSAGEGDSSLSGGAERHAPSDAAGYAADGSRQRGQSDSSASEDNRIQSQYGGAFQAVRTCQWLDITRIGCRLLGRRRLSAAEWLYLRMLLTGQRDLRTKYVMIDEVQDYTAAQLMVLKRYFPRARFMLLGDEFQAIREGTAAFSRIHELFGRPAPGAGRNGRPSAKAPAAAGAGRARAGRQDAGAPARAGSTAVPGGAAGVTELSLTTSYRSSPEITALFAALLPPEKQILVSSVQPSGHTPVLRACKGQEAYRRALSEAVEKAMQADGLTAILCAGSRRMEKTAAMLESLFPGSGPLRESRPDGQARVLSAPAGEAAGTIPAPTGKAAGHIPAPIGEAAGTIPVLRAGSELPERGVFLITLAHAKGLEFDGVILPDADAETYPDTVLGRHRLYTALSRATRRLTALSCGAMTPLLPVQ